MACRESSALFEAADGSELRSLVFEPAEDSLPLAGVVLFHGGGLRTGSVDDLAPHCRWLAARGVFAVSAGYRLFGRGAVSIGDCLADVRRAIDRFGRLAAARGLDTARLAVGGSSAGGHLALLAALTRPDGPAPDTAAVVALNPAGLDLLALDPEEQRRLEQRVGIAAGELIEYSLIEHVRPGIPPILIHHGTEDEVQPIDGVRRFRDAMVQSGNECTLLEYEHARHAFHYPGDSGHFDDVMDATARFLSDRLAAG